METGQAYLGGGWSVTQRVQLLGQQACELKQQQKTNTYNCLWSSDDFKHTFPSTWISLLVAHFFPWTENKDFGGSVVSWYSLQPESFFLLHPFPLDKKQGIYVCVVV